MISIIEVGFIHLSNDTVGYSDTYKFVNLPIFTIELEELMAVTELGTFSIFAPFQ